MPPFKTEPKITDMPYTALSGTSVIFRFLKMKVSMDGRGRAKDNIWIERFWETIKYGHIYEEGELAEDATCRNFQQVRQEGARQVERTILFYNLDMLIALGYRVRSVIATRFRQWATLRLKEYMQKGFTLDDDRLNRIIRREAEFNKSR